MALWDVHEPERATPAGHLDDARGPVAFPPERDVLVTTDTRRALRLWDVHDPGAPTPLGAVPTNHGGTVTGLAFDHRGRMLATSSDDKTVRLWDAADPEHPRALGAPLTGHTSTVPAVQFNSTGTTLLSAGQDGSLFVWDLSDAAHARQSALMFASSGLTGLNALSAAPNGHTVAVATTNVTVVGDSSPTTSWRRSAPRTTRPSPARNGSATSPAHPHRRSARRHPPAIYRATTGRKPAGPSVPAMNSDQDAFLESLYKAHGTALHGYVTSAMDGDRLAAEDVVQETMLRAWQHADTLTALTTPRAWLYTVARRMIIDRWRSRHARPREVGDSPLRFVGVPDHTEESNTSVIVRAALAELTPKYRAALVEVYLHDRTTREAVTVLDIPIGTVKSRIHVARRTLHTILDRKGVGRGAVGE